MPPKDEINTHINELIERIKESIEYEAYETASMYADNLKQYLNEAYEAECAEFYSQGDESK